MCPLPRRLIAGGAALLVAAGMAACSPAPSAPASTSAPAAGTLANPALALPTGTLTISRSGTTELRLTVQIAETQASQDTGLMGVRSMPDTAGMAFLFGAVTTVPFWMEDTLIPLDIAFWNPNGTIVGTQAMTPCTATPCTLYYAKGPYLGAVEMNAGLLARNGVRVGDTVTLKRTGTSLPSSSPTVTASAATGAAL